MTSLLIYGLKGKGEFGLSVCIGCGLVIDRVWKCHVEPRAMFVFFAALKLRNFLSVPFKMDLVGIVSGHPCNRATGRYPNYELIGLSFQ